MGTSIRKPTTSSPRAARFIMKVRHKSLRTEPWYVGLEDAALSEHRADAATLSALGRLTANLSQRRQLAADMYGMLAEAVARNGLITFADFANVSALPAQGLYVIFDPSEPSKYSDSLSRIVRIGTHGVALGSKSILRTRLRAHFGQRDGSGNHRASIFRLHVGNALIARDGLADAYPHWGIGMSADPTIKRAENDLEQLVSREIGRLSFTFLEIRDPSSPKSQRAILEHSFINYLAADGIPIEIPTKHWLGQHSPVEAIRNSGLWNIQHVGGRYDTRAFCRVRQYLTTPRLSGI
ncbi:hypothetical protein [Devosia sp.]|uniref:hypothetical protein n=1 Tax=Devosia sp. TaxID=1871048 RepID=UPI003A924CA6